MDAGVSDRCGPNLQDTKINMGGGNKPPPQRKKFKKEKVPKRSSEVRPQACSVFTISACSVRFNFQGSSEGE